ncbi:MAG: biosynthetic arginine decarboxylase [Xanthomonadaceae bacterium]|nr:biosynthetic arginine decarboxylase [Xanthomonadaceae bacterium]
MTNGNGNPASTRTTQEARDTYNISHWGNGYFDVNENGHLIVHPTRNPEDGAVDLHELASNVGKHGLNLPVLLRFGDILHDRINTVCEAFAKARQDYGYQGGYTLVYPIKVNQQRSVVEEIIHHGGNGRVGLEAGSKPELMAVLAMSPPGSTIICNGYKDREYLRLALIGLQLGHRVYIVVEKLSELDMLVREARDIGVDPLIGIRIRLASMGAGKWQTTGGEKSKFGLSATQVLEAVNRLKELGMEQCLQLLHFHLGSQIANIRDIQRGMREAARHFQELTALGVRIRVMDVGGGLGVDYEGTRSRSDCSMNYTVEQYALTVVRTLWEICSEHDIAHPDIITESGRAMTAHHAVLLTNVIDVESIPDIVPQQPTEDDPLILNDLWEVYDAIDRKSALEIYHEAHYWAGEGIAMYTHGVLTLEQRARVEQTYYAICQRVRKLLAPASKAHRQVLDELNEKLADKYFLNLSVFQSLPDVWAIDQLFPIIPLHRLHEVPTRRAVLQDLTCDSDGRVEWYVDNEGVEATMPIHGIRPGEPYLLGFFMVGAYQEILGDMHNLFGDTDSVNVELTEDGGYRLVKPEQGDVASDVLRYVHFEPDELLNMYKAKIAAADISDAQRVSHLKELDDGLKGYTYLEE